MDGIIFGLLVFTIITASVLATTVLLAASKTRLNRYLAVFIYFISFWALGDILMLFSETDWIARFGVILFYISPMITVLFLLFFSDSSPDDTPVKKGLAIPASIATLAIGGAIVLNPSIILRTIQFNDAGLNTVIPNVGIFYYIYSLYFTIYFIITYAKLILRYRHNRGTFKTQMLVVLIGVAFSSILGVISNLLAPQYGVYDKVWLGPVFTLIFAGATVFSIIKYRYLNIKLFVARSIAYLLLASTLIGFYVLVVFGLATIFLNQESVFVLKVVPILAALFIAATAPILKRLFDHITNRLFFRQNYSVHIAMNALSNHITRSVNAKQIQGYTLQAIDQTISPEYTFFLMLNNDTIPSASSSSGTIPSKLIGINDFLINLGKLHNKITVSDEVKGSTHMKHYFELGNVGVVARLTTSNKSIGFLVLGEKKNGSSYNGHDLQFLSLMSNDLALALQNAQRYEEIQAFNATLQTKVNDATEALKRTNKKLVALDDAKDEFISMASHQLRTPLTSIKGYTSMLLEGDLGKLNKNQKQALKESFDSSQRMVFLISDFLNVSRIRTGKFIIEPTATNLKEIVLGEISQLQDMAKIRGQVLSYKPPKNFPIVMCDENKTRQVMMNMIDNAIFYTKSGGTIEVSLQADKDTVTFKVKDNGIGVATGQQHRLFTKFFRAPNARQARPDGTGLGLFMAQKVITEQGGSIIFSSQENVGSTFGFRLPLIKPSS